jgi:hypothetical protein
VVDELAGRAEIGRKDSFQVALLHFYFLYNDQKRHTALAVLKCFLKQIAAQVDNLPSELSGSERISFRRDVGAEKILDLIVQCSAQFTKVFLLLDALDECDRAQRELFIPHLKALLQAGFKVYCTARPDLKLSIFSNASPLNIESTQSDIEIFLQCRLDASESGAKLSPQEKEEVIKTLTSPANGMYKSAKAVSDLGFFWHPFNLSIFSTRLARE